MTSTEIALTVYDAKVPATFGNKFMFSLVQAAAAEEEAQKLAATASEAKIYLGFEMIRAVFDLAERHEDIDVYAIFGKSKDVEKLNTRILMHMGVLKREITSDDEITYKWTDPSIAALYEYTSELKAENEAEYNRRFNNRKRLNMRLSEAYKSVATLMDNKLSPKDLSYSENEAGESVPTINNAPKAISGEAKDGKVQLGSRKPIVGAQMSPTLSSLVKLADKAHKEAKPERADAGEQRNGVAQMGISDEDFGGICNTVIRAINAKEGVFTEDSIKHLKSLVDAITPIVKKGVTKKAA